MKRRRASDFVPAEKSHPTRPVATSQKGRGGGRAARSKLWPVPSSPVSAADRLPRFRPDIQGLRALAVLAVVFYHSGVPVLTGGYVGVDVFFVISGFLITSHLLQQLTAHGRVSLSSFYAKRARRILPASFAVLGLSILAALIWYPPLLLREVWAGAVATAFYVPNLLFAAQGTSYLAETTPSLFQHYWSLGIEEQFYLAWPLILVLGFRWVKRPRSLFVFVGVLVVMSFVACVLLTFRQQPWAFFLLPTRAWELGVGGLAAFVVIYWPALLTGRVAAAIGWAGIGGIVASVLLFSAETAFPGYWAAAPVFATAAVIIGGASMPGGGPQAVLSTRPMMFIGRISYSLYLVHWPLLVIPQTSVGFDTPLPLWLTLLLAALAFPLAWLLYLSVEEPGRNGSWLAGANPRRTLLAAGVTSVLVAAAATVAYSYLDSRPLDAGRSTQATEAIHSPQFTRYVPTNLEPSLRAVSDDQPILYADGCHLGFSDTGVKSCVYGDPAADRIALFGDSHAAQWFPALLRFAEENGYSIETHTKSSCPSVSLQVLRDGIPYEECTVWRDSVIERLNNEAPTLVVLSNYGVAALSDASPDYISAWEDGVTATITALESDVILIADTPNMGTTPSICLSANLSDANGCDRDREAALSSAARTAESDAAESAGIPLIDMSDVLCSEVCAPIIGDTLIYRDAHHLTATASGKLGDELAQRIELATSR